jgi:hypothetical protein
MRFGPNVAAGIAALAGACVSDSDYVSPTYVSPSTFEHLTCRQIGEEAKRITPAKAAGGQDGKAADANATARRFF